MYGRLKDSRHAWKMGTSGPSTARRGTTSERCDWQKEPPDEKRSRDEKKLWDEKERLNENTLRNEEERQNKKGLRDVTQLLDEKGRSC